MGQNVHFWVKHIQELETQQVSYRDLLKTKDEKLAEQEIIIEDNYKSLDVYSVRVKEYKMRISNLENKIEEVEAQSRYATRKLEINMSKSKDVLDAQQKIENLYRIGYYIIFPCVTFISKGKAGIDRLLFRCVLASL